MTKNIFLSAIFHIIIIIITAIGFPYMIREPFDLPPIDVAIGDELAVVMSPRVSHGYQWAAAFPGSYHAGEGYTGPPSELAHRHWHDEHDYLFRTYVIPVLEPSSLTFGGFAIIALSAFKKLRSGTRIQEAK